MSSYRLLRSNKESGPFTQDELIAMGFKPYDLIWVDGKSAGWRYPSEIPELKAYAPVVEEQPYDRFYKRPVVPARGTPLPQNIIEPVYRTEEAAPAAVPVAAIPVAAVPVAATTVAAETTRPAFSPSTASVGKHIHVTLPSGSTLNVTALPNRREPEKSVQPAPEEQAPSFATTLASQPRFAPVAETLPMPTKRAAVAAIGLEEAVADKEPYYAAPAPAAAGGFSWTMMVGLIVGIATLVGLGIMIGLSMNHRKPELASVKESSLAQPQSSVQPVNSSSPAGQTPEGNPSGENTNSIINNAGGTNALSAANHPEPVTNPAIQAPAPSQQPVTAAVKEVASNHTKKGVPTAKNDLKQPLNKPVDKPATEAASSAKEPIVVKPKTNEAIPVVNLEKQVNIHNNGYKVGAFGGISDLQCTLVNDSRYALESVEVEVQYIQANDKVYKTEMLSFRDVAAGAQITLNAPKSPRGVKIISRIVKINTREPGLAAITIKS